MTSRTVSLLAGLALASTALLVGPTAPASATGHSTGHFTGHRGLDQLDEPLVVGHRGASGYRPEHTLASYRLAIRQGADYVEPDLVPTKDGVLVARHENEIGTTTDVADHPEFADRRTTKVVDGVPLTGWFTEDFTLAELKSLRAIERLPQVRPDNTAYDGRFEVPTFDEVLDLVVEHHRRTGEWVGVAPETKHPSYFDSIGLSLEEPMLRSLRRHGLASKRAKVLLQSFEVGNLQELDRVTDLPLEQLVDSRGGPADRPGTSYASMLSRRGLRDIARYADWVGPQKDWVLPRDPATGATGRPSAVVRDAHAAGLRVLVFTVRAENQFLATNFRRGTDPNAHGRVGAEIRALLDAGVDGLFADHPDLAVTARDAWAD
ncbi:MULTISPECIES: glycerophosphodiester phosphodiesterase [unclassified Nocardioides]|uniref:glycerophosphodiester phosphodiesterase n=1 Tax=unclassified Nocardioides TaxID=2615069 RepID=UPI003015450F